MRGFQITVSKSFVQRRDRKRESREWLKEIVERDEKGEEDKLAADAKANDKAMQAACEERFRDERIEEKGKHES
jgi:hypothetical protein